MEIWIISNFNESEDSPQEAVSWNLPWCVYVVSVLIRPHPKSRISWYFDTFNENGPHNFQLSWYQKRMERNKKGIQVCEKEVGRERFLLWNIFWKNIIPQKCCFPKQATPWIQQFYQWDLKPFQWKFKFQHIDYGAYTWCQHSYAPIYKTTFAWCVSTSG